MIETSYERGWGRFIPGVLGGILGAGFFMVALRLWTEGVFRDIGPARSADITMMVGLAGLCGGSTGIVLAVGAAIIYSNVTRGNVAAQQGGDWARLPAGRPTVSLPRGNLFTPTRGGRPMVTLDLPGEKTAIVPRDALESVLNADVVRREYFPHDKRLWGPIKTCLDSHEVLEADGRWRVGGREKIQGYLGYRS